MNRDRARPRLVALALAALAAGWECGGGAWADGAGQPGAADAPSPVEEAFREGLRLYAAGDYGEAIEIFERVYRERPAPAVLFNIAQAARLLGECRRAVDQYRRFIAATSHETDRARAEAWLAHLGDCSTEKPAVAPVAAVAPSPPAPAVAAAAQPSGPSATLAAGSVSAAPTRPVSAALTRGDGRKAGPRLSRSAVVLGAVAVALAAASGVSAWRAADAAERTSTLFRAGGEWNPQTAAVEREGKEAQAWSVAFLSGAAIAAAAAVILGLRRN